jgi:glycogen debranching enzyme
VVTPRRGKAVEINALWYNALRLLEGWLRQGGDTPEGAAGAADASEGAAGADATADDGGGAGRAATC